MVLKGGRRTTLQAELRKGWHTKRAGGFPSYLICGKNVHLPILQERIPACSRRNSYWRQEYGVGRNL